MASTGPLVGVTAGVTADQRRDQLAQLLAGAGARVVLAPVLRVIPLRDDPQPRAKGYRRPDLVVCAFVESVLRRGYRLALD